MRRTALVLVALALGAGLLVAAGCGGEEEATPTPDTITEEGAAPDFRTRIDARAGGASPTRSYLYLSFTDQGLEHAVPANRRCAGHVNLVVDRGPAAERRVPAEARSRVGGRKRKRRSGQPHTLTRPQEA